MHKNIAKSFLRSQRRKKISAILHSNCKNFPALWQKNMVNLCSNLCVFFPTPRFFTAWKKSAPEQEGNLRAEVHKKLFPFPGLHHTS